MLSVQNKDYDQSKPPEDQSVNPTDPFYTSCELSIFPYIFKFNNYVRAIFNRQVAVPNQTLGGSTGSRSRLAAEAFEGFPDIHKAEDSAASRVNPRLNCLADSISVVSKSQVSGVEVPPRGRNIPDYNDTSLKHRP